MPVLLHLKQCASCRAALSFTAASALQLEQAAAKPAAEQSEWAMAAARLAAQRLARRMALWQRRFERNADAIAAAAGNEGLVVFRSVEGTPSGRAWKAELVLDRPEGGTPGFSIRMLAVNGCVPAEGQFSLFGVVSPVRDGTAPLPADILANAANASGGVSFTGADGVETAGVPILDDYA